MKKILIANRGEIACRLILACRELGLATVAVFATPDADAPHVGLADEAYELPGDTPRDTYLDIDRLLAVGQAAGADAVHPGYGFLSENAAFEAACGRAGLVFVGPPAAAIARMGHKLHARQAVAAAGVPVLPGDVLGRTRDAWPGPADFPVMVKAACGGGGLGLRHVTAPDKLEHAMADARAQCAAAFSDAVVVAPEDVDLYWEAYMSGARHIEVQVAADHHGDVRHLGARECSIQRRFQKLIEECPPVALDDGAIASLGAYAVQAASAVGYRSLGTVEFLWTEAGGPVFLEMNTRLQVEHPVTELVTGLDLVQLQLKLAAGERLADLLPPSQDRGHAIEARLYAEDPVTGAPAPGRIDHLRWPTGPWVRVDAGVEAGQTIGHTFDPLLAKVIAWGPTRDSARRRLADALSRLEIAGTLVTNLALLRAVLADPDFAAGGLSTGFLAERTLSLPGLDPLAVAQLALTAGDPHESAAPTAAASGWAARRWRVTGGSAS